MAFYLKKLITDIDRSCLVLSKNIFVDSLTFDSEPVLVMLSIHSKGKHRLPNTELYFQW